MNIIPFWFFFFLHICFAPSYYFTRHSTSRKNKVKNVIIISYRNYQCVNYISFFLFVLLLCHFTFYFFFFFYFIILFTSTFLRLNYVLLHFFLFLFLQSVFLPFNWEIEHYLLTVIMLVRAKNVEKINEVGQRAENKTLNRWTMKRSTIIYVLFLNIDLTCVNLHWEWNCLLHNSNYFN